MLDKNLLTQKLEKSLDSLISLINYFEEENNLLKNFNESNDVDLISISNKFKEIRIEKLKFNYNCLVISLYGFLENYIEEIIKDYIENINKIFQKASMLSSIIKDNHFKLSLTLITKIQNDKRYRGALTKELIIANLYSCINENREYKLTKEAFSYHTANFRIDVIDEVFNQIDINKINSLVIKDEIFINYLINKGLIASNKDISINEALRYINELADLRNQVAHGVDSEITANETIEEYISFIKEYAFAIDRLLVTKLTDYNLKNLTQLTKITSVFQKNNVVCLFNENKKIKLGDSIYIKNSNEIKKAIVLEIQIDEKNVKYVSSKKNVEIGIKTDITINKSHKLYI